MVVGQMLNPGPYFLTFNLTQKMLQKMSLQPAFDEKLRVNKDIEMFLLFSICTLYFSHLPQKRRCTIANWTYHA